MLPGAHGGSATPFVRSPFEQLEGVEGLRGQRCGRWRWTWPRPADLSGRNAERREAAVGSLHPPDAKAAGSCTRSVACEWCQASAFSLLLGFSPGVPEQCSQPLHSGRGVVCSVHSCLNSYVRGPRRMERELKRSPILYTVTSVADCASLGSAGSRRQDRGKCKKEVWGRGLRKTQRRGSGSGRRKPAGHKPGLTAAKEGEGRDWGRGSPGLRHSSENIPARPAGIWGTLAARRGVLC